MNSVSVIHKLKMVEAGIVNNEISFSECFLDINISVNNVALIQYLSSNTSICTLIIPLLSEWDQDQC